MYKYGRNFWVICFSMFLFMTSFNLIIPELNEFITILGGANYKGLVITLFTISAAISRPFSGKLSDTIGRKKAMTIGMLASVIVSLLYPLSFSVFFFLCLRFLHGFSAGFFPTGATALLTDILPEKKRGQGMGIWGTFISLGIGFGQGFGSIISNYLGLNALFLIASLTAILSGILILNILETLENKQKFNTSFLKIKMEDVFEPSVKPAAIIMFLSATCSGIIFVLTPEISKFHGIENKGWFFIFYVITTIIVRLFFSSLSDKIGRRKTLTLGIGFLVISMLLIGTSHDKISYTISSIIFGIATGITSPTLFAWTADLSHPERRGVGAGTMFIALELGIMTGSLSTLLTYKNSLSSIPISFMVGAIFAGIGFLYLIWHQLKKESLT
jgi:MFS family permease